MKDVEIIGLIKTYVNATLVGMGALKGAPCQCVITENADGTHKVTMKWIDNNGDAHTDYFNVLNGQVGDMDDLGDVKLTNLANGEILMWDSTAGKWVNILNSATVNTLNAVGDVSINLLQDGQVLVWDNTSQKWINGDVAITVDSELSKTSLHPVENRVITLAIENLVASKIGVNGGGNVQSALDSKANSADLATVATSGSYNDLSNKPTIPAAQVQSDWGQTTSTEVDYIKNKPTLASVATSGSYNDLTNKPSLATVATSGDYDDLTNKPSLATVATSGDYDDLTNKPTIPAAQIQSDWTQSDNTKLDYIKNKPTLGTAAAANVSATPAQSGTDVLTTGGAYTALADKVDKVSGKGLSENDYTNTDKTIVDSVTTALAAKVDASSLASVATSGDYDDLTNKPSIPAAQIQSDWTQSDNTKLDYIKNKPSLLQLGETSSTAYRGDRGKTAYDHSQIANGTNPHATTANNINLATALTINGASKTTAEAAISALAGLVDHITDTEYNSIAALLS